MLKIRIYSMRGVSAAEYSARKADTIEKLLLRRKVFLGVFNG